MSLSITPLNINDLGLDQDLSMYIDSGDNISELSECSTITTDINDMFLSSYDDETNITEDILNNNLNNDQQSCGSNCITYSNNSHYGFNNEICITSKEKMYGKNRGNDVFISLYKKKYSTDAVDKFINDAINLTYCKDNISTYAISTIIDNLIINNNNKYYIVLKFARHCALAAIDVLNYDVLKLLLTHIPELNTTTSKLVLHAHYNSIITDDIYISESANKISQLLLEHTHKL